MELPFTCHECRNADSSPQETTETIHISNVLHDEDSSFMENMEIGFPPMEENAVLSQQENADTH